MIRINTCIIIAIGFAFNITQISFAQGVNTTNRTVESLIEQGKQQGLNYLSSRDAKLKNPQKRV